jgi:uncharacterized GH25 family protein
VRFLTFAGNSVLALLIALTYASASRAHDFWVQPSEYWLMPDAIASVTLQVGHGASRQRSPIPQRRITRFEAITPAGGVIDLRTHLDLGGAAQDGDFRFLAPGAYVLVLETDETYSRLPALRFNEYLEAEGLTAASVHRRRLQRVDADGVERYSRRAKSFVYVGAPDAGSHAQLTRPLGLKLEIVPEISPYASPRPPMLPVRVIYEGRPLSGALVKLTDLRTDEVPVEMQRTDEAGRAKFTMPVTGAWLVNVIWSRPLTTAADTEFETVFSSLVFGFPEPPACHAP